LLRLVDELDSIVGHAQAPGGLRDVLLLLHEMTHVVVNGAGLSGSADRGGLPELASDAASEIRQAIAKLQEWVKLIEPLETLRLCCTNQPHCTGNLGA
jgi:hypothetical protein